MSTSTGTIERETLLERTRSPEYSARCCATVQRIAQASEEAEVVELLRLASHQLGADAALFLSFVRDDATLASYRCLLACDPVWGAEYARNRWFTDDRWLQHALQASDPIRDSELRPPASSRQHAAAVQAATSGFRSAVIVPAPSAAGSSRVGMLCLGSFTQGFFEGEGYPALRLLVRLLAMELHEWWLRRIREQLVRRARITEQDLVLLRHEEQGHSSKIIAAALDTEAKTIDCRFQRLSAKLGAANRRSALRLAKLYGLI